MPRSCGICSHKERAEIERLIVAGERYRRISRKFAVSEDALTRHKVHIREALKKAVEQREVSHAVSVAEQLAELRRDTEAILSLYKIPVGTDEAYVALAAIARREKQIEIECRRTGEFQKDKPNQQEIGLQQEYFEQAVEGILADCKHQGIEITREEARDLLRRKLQEMDQACRNRVRTRTEGT